MNPYLILGVEENCSEEEIKKAFRRLAKIHHPDVSNEDSGASFKRILRAYEILKQNNYRWSNSMTTELDMEKVYESFLRRNPIYSVYFSDKIVRGEARWDALRKRPS
jgi:hypothetical protein